MGSRIGLVATPDQSANHDFRHAFLDRFSVVGPEFNPAIFKMDRDLIGFKVDSPVPSSNPRVYKGILVRIVPFPTRRLQTLESPTKYATEYTES